MRYRRHMSRIDPSILIRCQWCNTDHTLEAWDSNTYAECKSREMRRLYTPLYETKAFNRQAEKFYKCPKCGMWSMGCQLVILSDDPTLRKLGGYPIIRLSKKADNR